MGGRPHQYFPPVPLIPTPTPSLFLTAYPRLTPTSPNSRSSSSSAHRSSVGSRASVGGVVFGGGYSGRGGSSRGGGGGGGARGKSFDLSVDGHGQSSNVSILGGV